MLSRVLAAVAAFVLTAVASAPPALGQTATTKYLFKIVHGAVWRGIHGGTEGRYLTVGCAPLERKPFGASAQGSMVTLHLQVVALPRTLPDWVVWRSAAGQQCNLRKGLDTVTFEIPEGLGLDAGDRYLPMVYQSLGDRRFTLGGTHGRVMYRLRDYSRPLRGSFTPPPPGVIR